MTSKEFQKVVKEYVEENNINEIQIYILNLYGRKKECGGKSKVIWKNL